MVTKGNEVYCNICETLMGTIKTEEGIEMFEALQHIHDGGYLRIQFHDMHSIIVIYDCDYCPKCSKSVERFMKEINIVSGRRN